MNSGYGAQFDHLILFKKYMYTCIQYRLHFKITLFIWTFFQKIFEAVSLTLMKSKFGYDMF